MLARICRKGRLSHRWWERRPAQPLWEPVWRTLRKSKLETPRDPAIPLPGYIQRKQNHYLREVLLCSQ